MKVILIIGILAIIGYAVWKFIEAKRIKNANKPTIHKVSVKPTPAVKSTELQTEMKRVKKALDEAKAENDPMSFIKYEDEDKSKN